MAKPVFICFFVDSRRVKLHKSFKAHTPPTTVSVSMTEVQADTQDME